MGYNDEILDVCFAGEEETHLAIATNSNQLRMYDLSTMNCQLLQGHTGIVLTLAISNNGNMLVTGSKVEYVITSKYSLLKMGRQLAQRTASSGNLTVSLPSENTYKILTKYLQNQF